MSVPFSLDFDALNDHAKKVGQLAADVAGSAAGVGGGLGANAFGPLSSFLIASVDGVCEALRGSCSAVGETFAETSVDLREVAAETQELEYDIVALLREFGLR